MIQGFLLVEICINEMHDIVLHISRSPIRVLYLMGGGLFGYGDGCCAYVQRLRWRQAQKL
ncbi:hypothetical protein D3C73_1572300 [compost metagenome]